ncbi:ribonuclease H-like domain-containing protein [Mycena amicta]|nr:ribonuclease H-like domain-containing protein [Mycena amicta]
MSLPTDRAFKFCPSLSDRSTAELLATCPKCKAFLAKCCGCYESGNLCHKYQLVFVDGACPSNGLAGARAGIGCAVGLDEHEQLSLPVTDAMDPGYPRTSQRAELLAALHGLEFLIEWAKVRKILNEENRDGEHLSDGDGANEGRYIVMADSEYVVKGMTEWVPQWKMNNWKNKQNKSPANVDLFKRLEELVKKHRNASYTIQFMHVGRHLNALADRLAKDGADKL